FDTERFVDLLGERLTGDQDGYAVAAYVETGFNCDLAANLVLQPLASFQYTHLRLDAYTETGGVSALTFERQTYDSAKGALGARLTRDFVEPVNGRGARGQLRGRWVHEFGDTRSTVDTAFATDPTAVFTIQDAALSRDSAVLGAGFSADLSRQLRAYVDYDTRLSGDETVHVLSAALQYRW
ncbi:MAG: autotransporter outer membrane beta-barrel domain-containing protein, partial [Lentisphaerae bacterium]|nr:autotransporter outer membrane beta-barrel domain-containing protein [Lentisphaerota bacterium]